MKCTYCLKEIERGTGFAYVKKAGGAKYYCSKRCYRFGAVYNKKLREKE